MDRPPGALEAAEAVEPLDLLGAMLIMPVPLDRLPMTPTVGWLAGGMLAGKKVVFPLLLGPALALPTLPDRVLWGLTPPLRLRFLITSVFKLSGRTTPCNFRKRPHALHKG